MSLAIRTDAVTPDPGPGTAPARDVPEKSAGAFRTIKEAADELAVPQHVLRFWETRFSQVRPVKRAGGRRYYRPEDVDLLKGIRHLLHGQGYTIKGAQRVLRERGLRFVQSLGRGEVEVAAPSAQDAESVAEARPDPEARHDGDAPSLAPETRSVLEDALGDLRACAVAIARLRLPPEPAAEG